MEFTSRLTPGWMLCTSFICGVDRLLFPMRQPCFFMILQTESHFDILSLLKQDIILPGCGRRDSKFIQ